jgi:hypothetical protein
MSSLAEIARIKVEIAKLESALKESTDSQIQDVIQSRIQELKGELAKRRYLERE